MSLSTLKNATLNAVFAKDTTIAVKDFLKNNWPATGAHGNGALNTDTIRFDTKFTDLSKLRQIIIEPMPIMIKPMVTGGGRYRVHDRKRIQIYAHNHSAKQEKWQMEQQVFSMINANLRGMIADGIEQCMISEFQEIYVNDDNKPSSGLAQESITARSRAIVTLYYDMVKV